MHGACGKAITGSSWSNAPLLSLTGRHRFTDMTNGFLAYSARYLLLTDVQPLRDVFVNYELLFYLTVRAGQIGLRVGHVPVRCIYPNNEPVLTKINSLAARFTLLHQTLRAAGGHLTPKSPRKKTL